MDNMRMPPNGAMPPEGGSPPPGGHGPMIRLAAEYTLDFLAPANVPQKYLHVNIGGEPITAVLESEHGTQDCRDFQYKDGAIKFSAMLGSNGDELFVVVAKLYGGGVMLGEAAMEGEGKPKSPIVLKEI